MPETRAFQYQPATVLEVSGEDSFRFLQGQMSNDLNPRAPGNVTYGLWLSAKGKVEGDSFAIERADGTFLLVSPLVQADDLRTRLESFIIADDVLLKDVTTRWSSVAVWGPGALKSAEILGVPAPSGRHAHDGAGMVGFVSHRWGAGTIEWLFADGNATAVDAREKLLSAGLSVLPEAGAEQARILRGGVSVPSELGSSDLPQEAGVEDIAVSFTKGCFIGQEVMARLKSMGRVRRGLIRVRGEGAMPKLPADLFAGDRKVGELRSAAPLEAGVFIGRAMVTLTDLPDEFTVGAPAPHASKVARVNA